MCGRICNADAEQTALPVSVRLRAILLRVNVAVSYQWLSATLTQVMCRFAAAIALGVS